MSDETQELMTLDDFLAEARARIDTLEVQWRAAHKQNPEQYPMGIPKDNSGLWWEFLMMDEIV